MIFGQFFNRHEAWAPLAKAWVDYLARNALMLQQGATSPMSAMSMARKRR
jgi:hypothetical protein